MVYIILGKQTLEEKGTVSQQEKQELCKDVKRLTINISPYHDNLILIEMFLQTVTSYREVSTDISSDEDRKLQNQFLELVEKYHWHFCSTKLHEHPVPGPLGRESGSSLIIFFFFSVE